MPCTSGAAGGVRQPEHSQPVGVMLPLPSRPCPQRKALCPERQEIPVPRWLPTLVGLRPVVHFSDTMTAFALKAGMVLHCGK
jgi:hypothetical protein